MAPGSSRPDDSTEPLGLALGLPAALWQRPPTTRTTMNSTTTEQELTHAERNAKAYAEAIEAARDAYEFCVSTGEGRDLSREAKNILREMGYDGTNHQDTAEAIADQTREEPLAVDVRSGWSTPGDLAAEEFQILLSTGGPALRIVGELNAHMEPASARLEHQDWGTPWTEWVGVDQDALLWYASHFWFGEA